MHRRCICFWLLASSGLLRRRVAQRACARADRPVSPGSKRSEGKRYAPLTCDRRQDMFTQPARPVSPPHHIKQDNRT